MASASASIMKFLCVFFLLSLIGKGNCQPCGLNNILVAQSQTGKAVGNKPEWTVKISNNCICTQQDLKLSCDGFQTAEKIDPSVLSVSGGECLVNNGQPMYGNSDFTFTYAWDASFNFKPLSSRVSCS